METLSREQAVWAAGMGISIERAAWLLACPKFTAGTVKAVSFARWSERPNAYLAHINGSLYFRINRAGTRIIERCPQDIAEARAYRDRRLAELGLKAAKV